MKTLLNHVQPFKGFVYKDAKLTKFYGNFEWPEDRVVIEIVPRKNSRAFCSGCGNKAPGYDTLPLRLYDYLPCCSPGLCRLYTMDIHLIGNNFSNKGRSLS